MFVTHLFVNPVWGLAVAAIALVGGLSRQLLGRVSLVVGVVGGLSWTVSMLTAPYLDIDDILFPVAGTLLTGSDAGSRCRAPAPRAVTRHRRARCHRGTIEP